MTRPCRLVLIGMMGSGKTTVGRLIARRTGWPYLDNDELLGELVGKTPKELLVQDGEARLRASESAALSRGLYSPVPSIVGAAAGTILDPQNRRSLHDAGIVVWLRATPVTVRQRAMGAAHRAWLDTGGVAWIRDAIAERNPLYESVADLTVDVDRITTKVVAREILAWLRNVDACRALVARSDQP